MDFLTNKPQHVWSGLICSNAVTLNTRVPQHCVLSPLFYSLATHGCVCESVLITQWPRYIPCNATDRAEIHCYQNDTDYEYLYWYRQLKGKEIQLIVYLLAGNPNFESDFATGFEAVRSNTKQWSLTITSVQEKDEAVYLLCASYEQAYFGAGTKLTVLGKKAFEKLSMALKTLVCVASDFYPDHVSVFWELNKQSITDGVATDPAAKMDAATGNYTITSRLRVLAKHWFEPQNKFKCIVRFFDGKNNTDHSVTVSCKLI
uniref:Ig-like domain-containing protein n=1 Tax=Fundulus heteroclitus TaxID=8078 RepID=A0A3Q2P9I5_FUNHE